MVNFNENSIIERVKLLRQQHCGSRGQSKFARELDISPSTYTYYEKGRIPPIETLLKICEICGADLYWLLTGEKKQEKITELPEISASSNSDILQKLDSLLAENPDMVEAISAFIGLLLEKKDLEKKIRNKTNESVKLFQQPKQKSRPTIKLPQTNHPGWIPVLGRTAAGIVGLWDETISQGSKQTVTELDDLVRKHIGKSIIKSEDGVISLDLQTKNLIDKIKTSNANLIQVTGEDQQIVEFVNCEEIFNLFSDSFSLRVDGDSMSPRINDGDILILSRSVPAVQGQIGVAKVKNQIGVTCKIIRMTETKVHLIPINEKYETKIISKADLVWSLSVLSHIKLNRS